VSLLLRGVALAVAAAVVLVSPGRAEIASDQPAAILVFPKLLVDTSASPQTPRGPVDTLIRISNTSETPIRLHCFYVNANGHCPNAPATICDPYDLKAPNPCGDRRCEAGWQEINFVVNITARQPVAWLASSGATLCGQGTPPGVPCFPLGGGFPGFGGQNNDGSLVPPVPEDPFIGELKCIAVDRNDVPVERNDLIGEAEIIRSSTNVLDVQAYNAIGIQAIAGRNNNDNVLVLGGRRCEGGDAAGEFCGSGFDCPGGACVEVGEYEGCPNILLLNHLAYGVNDPISGSQVTTTLTLVPCTEDFAEQQPVDTVVQVLVFNEFEQRLSTSNTVTCFHEFKLPDLAGRAGADRSIFSAAVLGTLTGQTRLRGVATGDMTSGHTLLGIAEEFRQDGGSAAVNVHFHGSRPQSDFVYLP
jgi:hypothetical protein